MTVVAATAAAPARFHVVGAHQWKLKFDRL